MVCIEPGLILLSTKNMVKTRQNKMKAPRILFTVGHFSMHKLEHTSASIPYLMFVG